MNDLDRKVEMLKNAVGTRCWYVDDFGDEHKCITRSVPWKTSAADWVVLLDGVGPGYHLVSRLKVKSSRGKHEG